MAGNILSGQNSANNQQNSPSNIGKGNRLSFHGDRHFTYDNRGNLTEERRGTGGRLQTKYTYNSQNQLTKVEKDNQVFEYAYDPLGRRIRKKDAFGETEFLYNGDVLLSEKRNHQEKLYLFEPNSFKPLCFIENNQAYFYHNDHLGTPQEITTWEGQVVWSARYKVYGNVVRKDVEQVENNLRAPGQYYDAESGLHYSRHRYYDPGTGNFITPDPIGLLGGVNNYVYASNPVMWTDPLGLVCKERYERYKALRDEGYSVQDATNLSRAKRIDDPDRLLPAPSESNPWMPDTPIESDVVGPDGLTVYRAHGDGRATGAWVTLDPPPNQSYVRRDLAVHPDWNEATHFSEIRLAPGTRYQSGIAGPQDYPGGDGGGHQLRVLNFEDILKQDVISTHDLPKE